MGRGGAGWQRHQRERAAAGVELGRKVAMGQAMGEKRGQRALPVGVKAGLEPGGAARFRIPAVGADGEPGRDRASVFQPRPGGVVGEVVGGDAVGDPLEAGNAAGLVGERFRHPVVLDIPAERIEPDFGGVELDRARRKERSRVVDKSQRAQRRGLGPQPRPKAERSREKRPRGREGRRCGRVRFARPRRSRRRRSRPGQSLRRPRARPAPRPRPGRPRRVRPAFRRWPSSISRQPPRKAWTLGRTTGETARRNFDKAEAARSSRGRLSRAFAGGEADRAGHVDRKAAR